MTLVILSVTPLLMGCGAFLGKHVASFFYQGTAIPCQGQHRLWPRQCDPRGDRGRCQEGQRSLLHLSSAPRLRHAGRREGCTALWRSEAASGHRPCHHQGPPRSCCWTRPRRPWTLRARSWCRRRTMPPRVAGLPSLLLTAFPRSRTPTSSVSLIRA